MIKKVKNFVTEYKEEILSLLSVALLILVIVEFALILTFKVIIEDLVSQVNNQKYEISEYKKDLQISDNTIEDLLETEEWCITKYGEEHSKEN